MLNVAAINAYIIFRENHEKDIKRTEFIRNLGLGLVNEWLRLRKEKKNLPLNIQDKISTQINEPSRQLLHNPAGYYVRCVDCQLRKTDRKTKYACTNCSKPICMQHSKFFCQSCTE